MTAPTEFCLGASQQAWHMAQAACRALGMAYDDTSPNDIEGGINALKRSRDNYKAAAEVEAGIVDEHYKRIEALVAENAALTKKVSYFEDIMRRGGC